MILKPFHHRPSEPGSGEVPVEGADAKQHARVHEGVRDHAVDRACQHRAALRRGRVGDVSDPPHHGARTAQVVAGVPQGVVVAVHLQCARPFGLCKAGMPVTDLHAGAVIHLIRDAAQWRLVSS